MQVIQKFGSMASELRVRKVAGIAALVFASSVFARPVAAAPITFSATNGSNLSASVTFDVVGGNLQVTLTNTSLVDVDDPPDVLTAVFFDIPGVGALTPVSATLGGGSAVFFGSNGGGNVGGEWAYGAGLAGAPGGATEGIGSAGFGLFGNFNFNGPDLDPPNAVNGLNYGITSAGDNLGTGNAQVTGNVPLIQNQVVFVLSGLPAGFNPAIAGIANVSFQYGTALTEPNIGTGSGGTSGQSVVPEPASLLLLGSGLALAASRARKRNQKRV